MKNKAAMVCVVLAIVFGLVGCLDTGTRNNPGGFGSFVAGTFTSDYRPHIKTSANTVWLAAEQLKPGDILLLKDYARAEVTDVQRTSGTKTVYDLNVGRDHTLAVEKQGFVVSDDTISIQGVAYRSGGGGGCFPAGTEVWTESGPVAIETIGPGTQVYACNPANRRWALRAVLLLRRGGGLCSDSTRLRSQRYCKL
ncbi:hypothetical protein ES705_06596 [subsurface metagenome]